MRQSIFIGIMATSDVAASFAMQLVIITNVGVGPQIDALYACMVMPSLVLGIVQASLMHVLVPLLTVSSKETFRRDAWGLFLLIGVVIAAFAAVLCVLAPYWAPIIVPGFYAATRQLVVRLTRIQMIATVLFSEMAVLSAIHHARNRFIWPECTPVIGDLFGLALLIWALPKYGIFSVVWLNVASVSIQTLLLAPVLGRFQKPDLLSDNLRLAWKRIRPLLLGGAYNRTDVVLDRALSSLSRSGGFSLLYMSQQIYASSSQIICRALCAPILPQMSDYAAAGDWVGFRKIYRHGLLRVGGLTIGAYALFLLIGERSLRLAIGHSHVTAANVHSLWILMALSAGILIGGPVGQILATTLYSTGDTRSPTRVGAWAYTLGIFLKLVMFYWFGLKGLAFAISLYYGVCLVMLMVAIRRVVPVGNAAPEISI